MPDITPAAAPGSTAPASASPSTPAPSAPPATAAAGSTPAPAASSSSAVPPVPGSEPAPASSGEPPKERWPDILENARKKSAAETEARLRQKYAQYDSFERDPWSAVQGWLANAQEHSLYGPLVRQYLQEQFGGARGAQSPDFGPEPEPDVPIVDANGRVTGQTYSAQRLKEWQQWNQRKWQAEQDARFQSIEDREQARQARESQAQQAQESWAWANKTLTDLRKLPHFTEHEAAIRAYLEEHEELGDNIHAAYNHVLVTQVLPNLGQAEQQKVITSLQQKASGATVSPTGTAPGRPQFKTFREAAEYYAAHPEEASAMATRQER